ncbi:hypothetical protein BDZ88DRAFT_440929 [Geranomyces variabilis]|nr:hypothetical protein BDZ88DRAFT_440929 [Geranomyces variabilis]
MRMKGYRGQAFGRKVGKRKAIPDGVSVLGQRVRTLLAVKVGQCSIGRNPTSKDSAMGYRAVPVYGLAAAVADHNGFYLRKQNASTARWCDCCQRLLSPDRGVAHVNLRVQTKKDIYFLANYVPIFGLLIIPSVKRHGSAVWLARVYSFAGCIAESERCCYRRRVVAAAARSRERKTTGDRVGAWCCARPGLYVPSQRCSNRETLASSSVVHGHCNRVESSCGGGGLPTTYLDNRDYVLTLSRRNLNILDMDRHILRGARLGSNQRAAQDLEGLAVIDRLALLASVKLKPQAPLTARGPEFCLTELFADVCLQAGGISDALSGSVPEFPGTDADQIKGPVMRNALHAQGGEDIDSQANDLKNRNAAYRSWILQLATPGDSELFVAPRSTRRPLFHVRFTSTFSCPPYVDAARKVHHNPGYSRRGTRKLANEVLERVFSGLRYRGAALWCGLNSGPTHASARTAPYANQVRPFDAASDRSHFFSTNTWIATAVELPAREGQREEVAAEPPRMHIWFRSVERAMGVGTLFGKREERIAKSGSVQFRIAATTFGNGNSIAAVAERPLLPPEQYHFRTTEQRARTRPELAVESRAACFWTTAGQSATHYQIFIIAFMSSN